MNNYIKNIILIIVTILLNIFALFFLIFNINNFYDVLIFLIYIVLNTGLLYYFYIIIADIIKVTTVKGVIKNDFLINSTSNIIANLMFSDKKDTIENLLSKVSEQKVIIRLLKNYLPLTVLLLDEKLVTAIKDNNKETYTSTLKEKIITHINDMENNYNKVYVLLTINILIVPCFYYLLN